MEQQKKAGLFEGGYATYLLPGVLLQSVLIGGGYATGREIVSYGAKFGAKGWIAGIGVLISFAITAMLTFELARIYKTYDYKSMIRVLIGPLWPLFDIAYAAMMMIIIAVMASASGSIVEEFLGLNYWIGVVLIVAITCGLIFLGDALIERFETIGTILLYVGYIIFTVMVLAAKGSNIGHVFSTGDMSYSGPVGTGSVLWTGVMYIAYNLFIFPTTMFSLKRQTSRKQTILSGIFAGAIMTIPWFMTYFAMMCFYPSAEVLGDNIPWLIMMNSIGAPRICTIAFAVVMGWTLIETSTGVIHALIGRLNEERVDGGKKKLSPISQSVLTIVILVTACAMSKFGITALIDKGYGAMSIAFLILYLLPLLTVGVYKILKKEPILKEELKVTAESAG